MATVLRPHDVMKAPLNGLTFVSAYSGCGGMDIGFRLAGFSPVWANEIDAIAAATYRTLLGSHIVEGDIDGVELPEPGSADVVIGGPPCQGFSVAGKMDPGDPRSQHVSRFIDLVERVQPQAFVMENVKALAVNVRWEDVRTELQSRARELGFQTSLVILHAADFGVPQRRERMFLIGIKHVQPPSVIPAVAEGHLSVREALALLPHYGAPGNDTICTAAVTPAKRPVLRPSPFQGSLLFNGNGRHLRLDRPAPTLPASMGGNATPIVDQHELDTGETPWVVGYHERLLKGRKPVRQVPRSLRRITVEEAAQLQGFPIGMTWAGTTSARYRQIGNAVPPLLARAVAGVLGELLSAETVESSLAAA